MRVLHVTPAYYPATYWGGPIYSVFGLNNSLVSNPEIELKVLTTDSAGPLISNRLDVEKLDLSIYRNYEVIFTHRIVGASTSFELLMKLPQLIHWADVVHLTATYSFPTIPTLSLCMVYKKPVVWSPRGALLDAQRLSFARKKMMKKIWNMACNLLARTGSVVLHVTSQDENIVSLEQIPDVEAEVIPNGVDVLELFPIRSYVDGGQLRLLFIGRLDPKKGIENLLDALSLLNDQTIFLKICGAGENTYVATLIARAEKLSLTKKIVTFAGHLDGKNRENAFLDADVCVVPSYSENFAMVVAEALAHGVPVIASKGTPWQNLEDKQCGLWVENDPTSLAQAVQRIRLMDLAAMGKNGWQWMKDEFEWRVIADRMNSLYSKVINGC